MSLLLKYTFLSPPYLIIQAEFDWDDIGSWESLERINQRDEQMNTVTGERIFSAENKNAIIANRGKGHVAVVGVENVLVVAVDDTTLVISRDKLPELKSYMAQMKSNFPEELF
jgi:mannose-1-phosphate guanylyltransferase